MTDQYGVIGHPIAHSKSPIIHAQFAEQTQQDIEYSAFDIAPEELPTGLEQLVADGLKGLNVTVPHKTAIADLLHDLSERARISGAVNTISIDEGGGLSGDNTDGVGLVLDLQQNLSIDLAKLQILVLGAGGATRGIVPALLEAGPEEIMIANRTLDKARLLAEEFASLGKLSCCEFDDLGGLGFDLIINATSAGLDGGVPPFPGSIINPDVVCYDLSYAMKDTPFVAWARQRGAEHAHQGWGMLIEQAAESFYIWRGIRPDTGTVRRHLPA
jgi:shikimate dehydrogenase